MVFDLREGNTLDLQGLLHRGIALPTGRFIVLGCKDGLHAQCHGQCWNLGTGKAVAHDQTCRVVVREFTQCGIDLNQRLPDKFHAAVLTRQLVQNVGIENKCAMHLTALGKCCAQRRVVLQTQVTP